MTEERERGQKRPINRPCSACSAGDYKMEYHDHHPPFADDPAPSLEKAAPEQPIHRQNCAVFQNEPCNCGLEWKVPVIPRVATAGGEDWIRLVAKEASEEIAKQGSGCWHTPDDGHPDLLPVPIANIIKRVIRKHHAGGKQ